MNADLLLRLSFACAIGAYGIFFFVIGLRGVVDKMPFLIATRWICVPWVVWAALFILPTGWPPEMHDEFLPRILNWSVGLMLMGLFVWAWFGNLGYTIFAVTDMSFREGLRAALVKLDLPVEDPSQLLELSERQGGYMQLQAPRVILKVGVNAREGTGYLGMPRQFSGHLHEIAKEMNEYYKNARGVSVNLRACKFNLIFGLALVLMAIATSFPPR